METDVTGDASQHRAEFDMVVTWALQEGSRRAATGGGSFAIVLLARVEEGALVDEIEVGLAPEPRSVNLLDALAPSVLHGGRADFTVVVSRVSGGTIDVHALSASHEMIVAARPDQRGDYRATMSGAVWRRRDPQVARIASIARESCKDG